MHESGQEFMEGMWESVTIERSAAGRPGILIIMERRDGDLMEDQMVVTVKNGVEFLGPVLSWLMAGPDGNPAPTVAMVSAFKQAWHEADAAEMTGSRVEAGLVAALQEMLRETEKR